MVIRRYANLTLSQITDVLDPLTDAIQKMRFTNAMWDETARINTVSPAGQMEAAEDDTLPEVPELNMPPRYVKKYAFRFRDQLSIVSH
jgi:hypothetical protein